MTDNFFDRLEDELGALARQGTHLDRVPGPNRRRIAALLRRSAVIVVLAAVFLAGALAEDSLSSAGGQTVDLRPAVLSDP